MSPRDCLSMLELAAINHGEELAGASEHLAACPRCRSLLRTLPHLSEPTASAPATRQTVLGARPMRAAPDEIKTGQIWTATVEGQPSWRELVAVLATQRSVAGQELLMVAPVHTALSEAAESDLVVHTSPTGYPVVVGVWAQGTVLRSQLSSYLGRLELPERQALVAIYRNTFGPSQDVDEAFTGPRLRGPEDPRALARQLRSDDLRQLFRPADELLGGETESASAATFGELLDTILRGDEWDRPTLLTASSVDGHVLDSLLNDQFDLTDQADIPDVQRVLNVVQLDDWRSAVRYSLERSPGGERHATGAEPAIAARAFAGVSDADRERDLTGDQTDVDGSPEARSRAIESYLSALEKLLDDQ